MPKYAELDERSLDYEEYTAERVRYQPLYESLNRAVPKPLEGEGLVPFKLRMLKDAQRLAPIQGHRFTHVGFKRAAGL